MLFAYSLLRIFCHSAAPYVYATTRRCCLLDAEVDGAAAPRRRRAAPMRSCPYRCASCRRQHGYSAALILPHPLCGHAYCYNNVSHDLAAAMLAVRLFSCRCNTLMIFARRSPGLRRCYDSIYHGHIVLHVVIPRVRRQRQDDDSVLRDAIMIARRRYPPATL